MRKDEHFTVRQTKTVPFREWQRVINFVREDISQTPCTKLKVLDVVEDEDNENVCQCVVLRYTYTHDFQQ